MTNYIWPPLTQGIQSEAMTRPCPKDVDPNAGLVIHDEVVVNVTQEQAEAMLAFTRPVTTEMAMGLDWVKEP